MLIRKKSSPANWKAKLKDESLKIREANFVQELELDIKRVETVKKIKKYHQQTEKHASSLEEQNKLKMKEIEQKERAVIERKRKLESERQNWVEGLNRRRDERLQGNAFFIKSVKKQRFKIYFLSTNTV